MKLTSANLEVAHDITPAPFFDLFNRKIKFGIRWKIMRDLGRRINNEKNLVNRYFFYMEDVCQKNVDKVPRKM